mgnify:FL=1
MHFSEGGYEAISSKLFKELNASTYCASFLVRREDAETDFLPQTSNVCSRLLLLPFTLTLLSRRHGSRRRIRGSFLPTDRKSVV